MLQDILNKEANRRRNLLREHSARLHDRAYRKDELAADTEKARVAFNTNPNDTTELALHRAILQGKHS